MNVRIGGAIVLGIAVVAMAFYAREDETNDVAAVNNVGAVAVVDTTSRHYIETVDSDGDGIMDWEEELQNKIFDAIPEPILLEDGDAGTTTFTEPETFTEQFAQTFFQDFMQAKIDGTPPENQSELLAAAITSIEQHSQSRIYGRADIIVIEGDTVSIREYGNKIADIISSYAIEKRDEGAILAQALERNDPELLKELEPIREVYENAISETLLVPVPEVLIDRHLDILNTYQAVLADIGAMEEVFHDPLYTLARMKRYEDDARGLHNAFLNMNTELIRMGITYANDEPGVLFHLFSNI